MNNFLGTCSTFSYQTDGQEHTEYAIKRNNIRRTIHNLTEEKRAEEKMGETSSAVSYSPDQKLMTAKGNKQHEEIEEFEELIQENIKNMKAPHLRIIESENEHADVIRRELSRTIAEKNHFKKRCNELRAAYMKLEAETIKQLLEKQQTIDEMTSSEREELAKTELIEENAFLWDINSIYTMIIRSYESEIHRMKQQTKSKGYSIATGDTKTGYQQKIKTWTLAYSQETRPSYHYHRRI